MAARRLVVIMLMMLAFSSLLAALAPPRPGQETETSTATSPTDDANDGELVRARVRAGDERTRPARIGLREGDQLALVVTSRRPAQISIPELGLVEDALPLSPARFDVFANEAGRYELRSDRRRQPLALIEVRRPRAGAPRGRGS